MNTGSALARFTITLSTAVTEPVQVEWYTSDGTAKAYVDYAANKGTAVFEPGETAKVVDILVYGRAVGTEDRSFFVEMLPPTNAILGSSIGECIIHVDTSGSQPVTQIIVPTGPKGDEGESTYETWLQLPGNAGKTEQEFIDSLKPNPVDFAEQVAPLIDVGSTTLTAQGTESLSKPDATSVKAVARRVAYASAAKIATVTLADGDNTLRESDLSGDALNFSRAGFMPRVLRNNAFIEPEWRLNQDGTITVQSVNAGEKLYGVQYDFVSDNNTRKAILSVTESSYYTKHASFEKGSTAIKTARDALLWSGAPAGQGPYYVWSGALPKNVPANSTPQSTGGVGNGAWVSVGNTTLRSALSESSGASLVGISQGITLDKALYFVTPEMFGAKSDGDADDTAAINAAIATGKAVITAGYYFVSGTIKLLAGTRIIGAGGRFRTTSTAPVFSAVDVDDWSVEGRLMVIGRGAITDQGQIGFLESGCQNYRVSDITFYGIAGKATYQPTTGKWEAPRGNKGTWTNIFAFQCYMGHEGIANSVSSNLMNEFTTWVNFKASGCQIALRTSAGNVQWVGGMLVDNVEGFTCPEVGTNTTHGQVVGMTIAHNSLYNVNMVAQTAGFTFSGCSIYGDAQTIGVIRLDRCRGVKFIGGNLEASIYNDGPGTNFVIGCYNNNNFVFFRSGINPEGIVITDMYDQGGYSSRNDVFYAHSEATFTNDYDYGFLVSQYQGRMAFNFSARDPQKMMDVTSGNRGYRGCPISGRMAVSAKIHITDFVAGAAVYLSLVRVRANTANEEVCYQVIPNYSPTAAAGCMNTQVDVVAGDAIFLKITVTGGGVGKIIARSTEFAAHYIGGAG